MSRTHPILFIFPTVLVSVDEVVCCEMERAHESLSPLRKDNLLDLHFHALTGIQRQSNMPTHFGNTNCVHRGFNWCYRICEGWDTWV